MRTWVWKETKSTVATSCPIYFDGRHQAQDFQFRHVSGRMVTRPQISQHLYSVLQVSMTIWLTMIIRSKHVHAQQAQPQYSSSPEYNFYDKLICTIADLSTAWGIVLWVNAPMTENPITALHILTELTDYPGKSLASLSSWIDAHKQQRNSAS